MVKKSDADKLVALIDAVAEKYQIRNKAHFSVVAQTLYAALKQKRGVATSSQPAVDLDVLIASCWLSMQKRNALANIVFYDIDDTNATLLVVNMPDLPFIVDSVRIAVSHCNLQINRFHNVAELPLCRDQSGVLQANQSADMHNQLECLVVFELGRVNQNEQKMLAAQLHKVLTDVNAAVLDWRKMQAMLVDAVGTWDSKNGYAKADLIKWA